MQVRITRFKMRQDAVTDAAALMTTLRGEIMGQPGIRHCTIVMNPDGAGHVIARIDTEGGSPEAVDRVRTIWHRFHDFLETVPDPEIYEVVADWAD